MGFFRKLLQRQATLHTQVFQAFLYSEFRKTLAENPDLLRFHYHKLNLIQKQLYELNMPLREYQTDMINLKATGLLKKKEAENGWLLAQLHGNLTPAHADGCGARCFVGIQCASLIILPAHPRPQVATPVLRLGFVAHLFGRGPVLRTCNRVMAHRPTGSTQTDRIRLPYAAPEASRRAFFVKERYRAPHGKGETRSTRP